ncbi:MAG: cytochrome c oxidase subunit II [Rhodospirillales bacterium]|nr:cytochrome c oxidase subunit II [Rhodospirillales bacterium]
MIVLKRFTGALRLLPLTLLLAGPALAQSADPVHEPAVPTAAPHPWELLMQTPESPVQHAIENLHNFVLIIILAITALVGVLLVVVLTRFNAKRHPVPSRTSHNTPLEVAWTLIPALILVVIAIPSFKLVFYEDHASHPALTVQVTGHQWYWEYSYPGEGKIDFSSYIVPSKDLKPGQRRLLTASAPMVVPAGEDIQVLTTSSDVIHSFFVPSLGLQRYAIPGRTIRTWFRADKPGLYVGECNQICGTNHSRMPINILAVTPKQFQAWVVYAKKQYADNAPVPTNLTASAGGVPAPVR